MVVFLNEDTIFCDSKTEGTLYTAVVEKYGRNTAFRDLIWMPGRKCDAALSGDLQDGKDIGPVYAAARARSMCFVQSGKRNVT